jgi:hypothetical protein
MNQELADAIRGGHGYDYFCQNGHDYSKSELVDILKEYDYAIHRMNLTSTKETVYDTVASNIEELID